MSKKTLTATGQTLKRGQALKVDRDEVKATVIAVGYEEAAKIHGIKPGTVREWGKRGNWIVTPRQIIKAQKIGRARLLEAAKTMPREQSQRVCKSVQSVSRETLTVDQALTEHMDSCRTAVRRGLSTALRKASQAAEDMDGLSALDASRKIKDIADTARTVLGIGEDTGAPTVNVTLLGVGLDALLQRQRERIIDVTPRG